MYFQSLLDNNGARGTEEEDVSSFDSRSYVLKHIFLCF